MKTLNVEDGKKGTLYVDSSPTTMFVDTISLIDEKFDKIEEKIEKTDKNCSNISKKLQKTEENAKILAKNDEKLEEKIANIAGEIYGILASEYISVDMLRKREYLISTKFCGNINSRKLKKALKKRYETFVGFKKLKDRVINYDSTCILMATKLIQKFKEYENLVEGNE